MTTRPCGHYGCNFQEECLECHTNITEEQVDTKKVDAPKKAASPAKPAAVKQVASVKAPKKVSPPSTRRPKRAVRSIYQRDEPMEESESKKAKKKRAKIAMKQVLPASQANKKPTKPDKASATHILLKPTPAKYFFPRNLHAMITEIASVAPAVVSWIEGGEAFIIHDPESAKLGEVLQKHFNRKFRL